MRRATWTAAQEARLRALYPGTPTKRLVRVFRRPLRTIYSKAHRLGLRKSAAYLASPAAHRLRRGDNSGEGYRFPKGHTPHNKGLQGWQAGGRSTETRFRKGCLNGMAALKLVPIGTETTDKEGYRKRKVSDNRDVPSRFNWAFVHILMWEHHRGPIPEGHAIVFRNGDKTDIRIRNLECITRRELMRRNSVHRLPKALAEVIQLRGALVSQIHRRST